MSAKSIIGILKNNNWEISNAELMNCTGAFLSLYGKKDAEYSEMVEDESLVSWSSANGRVTIDRYQANNVTSLKSADGDYKSKTDISVDGEVVYSGSEYLNPLAGCGNKDYLKDKVAVAQDSPWLIEMYIHHKNVVNERNNENETAHGM